MLMDCFAQGKKTVSCTIKAQELLGYTSNHISAPPYQGEELTEEVKKKYWPNIHPEWLGKHPIEFLIQERARIEVAFNYLVLQTKPSISLSLTDANTIHLTTEKQSCNIIKLKKGHYIFQNKAGEMKIVKIHQLLPRAMMIMKEPFIQLKDYRIDSSIEKRIYVGNGEKSVGIRIEDSTYTVAATQFQTADRQEAIIHACAYTWAESQNYPTLYYPWENIQC